MEIVSNQSWDKCRQRKCQSWEHKACTIRVPPCEFLLVLVQSPFFLGKPCQASQAYQTCLTVRGLSVFIIVLFGMRCFFFFFCSSVWFCMVSGLRVDIGSRCMPTGWQGHWPKDKAFSTSAVCFCFAQQHSAPTVSLHFALYFAIFQTHIIKEKHWESYLWPSVSILIY